MFLPKVKVELINPEDNIRFIRNYLGKEKRPIPAGLSMKRRLPCTRNCGILTGPWMKPKGKR